ncbi:MAG: hypothetical protein R2761_29140 [Acidimicrobiales bacterium]
MHELIARQLIADRQATLRRAGSGWPARRRLQLRSADRRAPAGRSPLVGRRPTWRPTIGR